MCLFMSICAHLSPSLRYRYSHNARPLSAFGVG